MTAPAATSNRVPGLDAIRFLAAAWVTIGHFSIPHFAAVPGTVEPLIAGAPAVVVFFVISGFCIHYPARETQEIDLLAFYARRHLRILLPVFAAIVMTIALKVAPSHYYSTTLWTIVCEEIYYAIYPALLWLHRRVSWELMIAVAFGGIVLHAIVLRRIPPYRGSFATDWWMNLSVWLAGCWLAENYQRVLSAFKVAEPSAALLWTMRLAMWVIVFDVAVVSRYVIQSYGFSMRLIGLPIVLWLALEIRRAAMGHTLWIERWGRFTFSLYLVHPPILRFLRVQTDERVRTAFPEWIFGLALVAVATPIFYHLIEAPAHRLARQFAAWVVELRERRQAIASAS